MKNIIIGTAGFLIVLLLVMTIYTLQGREARNEEIHDGLQNALAAAGETMKEPETYKSNESLEAAFLGNLIQQLDSSSEVEVHVLKADKEKGIISAEVTETYRHPNGKEGKVSCRRTFVLDQRDESLLREKKSYLINFYAEGDLKEDNLYKSSLLLEGEEIKEPKVPEKKEHIFLEWRNARTHEKAEFNGGVYQEENFYAVWTEAR